MHGEESLFEDYTSYLASQTFSIFCGTQKFAIIFKTAPARTSYVSGKSSPYTHII